MLISENYRHLNEKAHEDPLWGTTGHNYAGIIRSLANVHKTRMILDYGAGKQTLEKALPDLDVTSYDPSIPELSRTPGKHDIIACIDVMEHVEQKCIDDVLKDLSRVMGKAGFFLICTVKAQKCLPGGVNAHATVKPYSWWLPKIFDWFTVVEFQNHGYEFMVTVSK